jgi:uncharacterized OB-fold protein
MNMLPTFASNAPGRYRELLESGIATLPYCERCERYFYYPRARCPRCGCTDAVDFVQPREHLVVRSHTRIWRPHSHFFEGDLPALILACSIRSDATIIAEGWGWPTSQFPSRNAPVAYVVRQIPDRGFLAGFVPLN